MTVVNIIAQLPVPNNIAQLPGLAQEAILFVYRIYLDVDNSHFSVFSMFLCNTWYRPSSF